MINLSIIIVSDAKSDYHYKMTQEAIDSATYKNELIKEIIVIEKQKVEYNNVDIMVCTQDMTFNYNKFLNLGIEKSSGEHIALCNNDLIFSPNWDSVILKVMRNNEILSASPLNADLSTPGGRSANNNLKDKIIYGYRIAYELLGWCIVIHRDVLKLIGNLDESVKFWYSDDLYAKQLQNANIKHALIGHCIVRHLCSETFKTLSEEKQEEYKKFE